jgi:ribosomal protein S27AE
MKILQKKNEEKSRKNAVISWLEDNPDGTQAQCARELKVSRKTVSKWVAVKEKAEKRKNLCPKCGTLMIKTKIEPYFWSQKSKFYTRIDKDCPNCQHHIKGKAYACKGPER